MVVVGMDLETVLSFFFFFLLLFFFFLSLSFLLSFFLFSSHAVEQTSLSPAPPTPPPLLSPSLFLRLSISLIRRYLRVLGHSNSSFPLTCRPSQRV